MSFYSDDGIDEDYYDDYEDYYYDEEEDDDEDDHDYPYEDYDKTNRP